MKCISVRLEFGQTPRLHGQLILPRGHHRKDIKTGLICGGLETHVGCAIGQFDLGRGDNSVGLIVDRAAHAAVARLRKKREQPAAPPTEVRDKDIDPFIDGVLGK